MYSLLKSQSAQSLTVEVLGKQIRESRKVGVGVRETGLEKKKEITERQNAKKSEMQNTLKQNAENTEQLILLNPGPWSNQES